MNRRHSPFEEMDALFERMGREFDVGAGRQAFDVDVRTDDDRVVVSADLPGYDRGDIDVSLDGRTLSVRAERTSESGVDAEEGDYVRRERRNESVSRTLGLPVDVDDDGAEATYNNGVLTVSLPRADEQGHRIDVSVE